MKTQRTPLGILKDDLVKYSVNSVLHGLTEKSRDHLVEIVNTLLTRGLINNRPTVLATITQAEINGVLAGSYRRDWMNPELHYGLTTARALEALDNSIESLRIVRALWDERILMPRELVLAGITPQELDYFLRQR